jgi:hypothetical protein
MSPSDCCRAACGGQLPCGVSAKRSEHFLVLSALLQKSREEKMVSESGDVFIVWLLLYPIAPEPNLGPRLRMTDPAQTPPRAVHWSHGRSFVCY